MMKLVLFLSLISPVFCDLPFVALPTFQRHFQDPYSGTAPTGTPRGGSDALLDIDVESICPNNIQVAVTIPTVSSDENNAAFDGPSFSARPVWGVSRHSAFNGGVAFPAIVWVAWDLPTHTITFSNLGFTPNVFFPTFVDGNPDWYNINFDIPDSAFVDPDVAGSDNWPGCLANNPTNCVVPLNLETNADRAGQPPFVNLIAEKDFYAYNFVDPDHPCRGNSEGNGDPVFSGFQGQVYQFHGLPDEHFNLVSSPDVALNAHFVYLSSGKCDYNDTECFTHPGTYMDQLGFSIIETHIKLIAGTHEQGLRIWINDKELQRGARIGSLSTNTTASLRYHHNGRVEIRTEIMSFEIANSDMFMNIRAGLNDQQLLTIGSIKHTVTDHNICKANSETYNHQLVESTVAKKYPVTTPLHGLIGQTWRNVKVCHRDWMGTVQDYLVSDLFANDNPYSYFKW